MNDALKNLVDTENQNMLTSYFLKKLKIYEIVQKYKLNFQIKP